MAGNKAGAERRAAYALGLTVEQYAQQRAAGLKHCTKCRAWKPVASFGFDRTRGDGLATACLSCRNERTAPGPTKPERQAKRKQGLAWCRRCEDWLPVAEMRQGLCRAHINAEARQRYATDPAYRRERRQHAHSRRRGVRPLPVEGEQYLLDCFWGLCVYCGGLATTWDHLLAVSKGGQTEPGNVVPACVSCNSAKGDGDVLDFIDRRGIPFDGAIELAVAVAILAGHIVP